MTVKSSKEETRRKEEEWFLEKEKALLAKMRAEREARAKEELTKEEIKRRDELKKAHWMHCPKCGTKMVEIDYDGVMLDSCNGCDGLFFDRNELEAFLFKKQEERRNIFMKMLGIG